MGRLKDRPGKDKMSFRLVFKDDWFVKNDVIVINGSIKAKVLTTPSRKWWKLLFQRLTFGLYKAPWYYTVKRIEDENSK